VDRETLQALRDHHLAFLKRWLTAEQDGARDAWIEQGALALERWRALPIERLVRREDLDGVLTAVCAEAIADGVVRPVLRSLHHDVTAVVAGLDATVAELIGAEARRAVETLAEQPDVIDAAMVRAVTREPAMEAVMRDVLFEALVAFNERTNPFVAPWGVPALLDALPRVGRGAIRKTFDTVRSEFERRLEPEMRRFLEGFSRKSLDTMVDLFVDKAAEPELVGLRRHAAGKILDRPIAEIVWPAGDPRQEALGAAIEAGVAHALTEPQTRSLLEQLVQGWWERHAGNTLDDVFGELAITPPDPTPLLVAGWPAAQAALLDDAVLAVVAELIDRSHDEWLATR